MSITHKPLSPPKKFNDYRFVSQKNAVVTWVNENLGAKPGMESLRGAAFCVTHRSTGALECFSFGGEVEQYKKINYGTAVQQDADNGARPHDDSQVLISGVVLGSEFVWLVRGYTPEVDDLAAIGFAFGMGDIDEANAHKLVSGNVYCEKLDEFLAYLKNAGGPR